MIVVRSGAAGFMYDNHFHHWTIREHGVLLVCALHPMALLLRSHPLRLASWLSRNWDRYSDTLYIIIADV